MNEEQEQVYLHGQRAAWLSMLRTCLRELGLEDAEPEGAWWVLEREEAMAVLRRVCEEYGDNDWSEYVHLADVIDKHLFRHLQEKAP